MKRVLILVLLVVGVPAYAGTLAVPHVFVSGTPAKASDVNENFGAVKTAVDDNANRIAAQESTAATQATAITALQTAFTAALARITTLETNLGTTQTALTQTQAALTTTQTNLAAAVDSINALTVRVAALESNPGNPLSPYVTVVQGDLEGLPGPHILFTGVNVHIKSGPGATINTQKNGLGNLIIGSNKTELNHVRSHDFIIGYGGLNSGMLTLLDSGRADYVNYSNF